MATILLDIDGVSNPVRFLPQDSSDWQFEPSFKSTKASGGFTLNLSREMAAAILGLGCDIRWLTTWGHHAHFNIGMHFDWINYPVLAEPPESSGMYGGGSDWLWKPRAVMDFLKDPGDKVVWIDDDADDYVDHWQKHGLVLDPHNRLLVICPETNIGLTRDHIKRIDEFLK